MKNVLVVLAVLVAAVVGLGFYQGWFNVTADKSDPNKNVKLSVDEEKFKEDKEKAKEKLQQKPSNQEPSKQP